MLNDASRFADPFYAQWSSKEARRVTGPRCLQGMSSKIARQGKRHANTMQAFVSICASFLPPAATAGPKMDIEIGPQKCRCIEAVSARLQLRSMLANEAGIYDNRASYIGTERRAAR
jgi:hypothetical protein